MSSASLLTPFRSTDTSKAVLCNKFSVKVKENLYDFLRQWAPYRECFQYIWVDALCINQIDKAEQSRQVNTINQIYTTARRVLIWLGPQEASTDLAFKLLNDLETELVERRDPAKPQARAMLDPHKVLANNENLLLDLARWKALSSFFARTWFSRA